MIGFVAPWVVGCLTIVIPLGVVLSALGLSRLTEPPRRLTTVTPYCPDEMEGPT